jgi:predicted secreted protein
MEKPYSGLTALIKINGVKVAYLNNLELNLEKDIAEVLQFGAQYKEKLPTIKNWTASNKGTVAFAAGESQHKLYQAFESGELVTLTVQLDQGVYFEGNALVSNLSISGAPDDALSISVEFEGSGGITFTLPQTVQLVIRSSVGGTTDPAGVLRVAKTTGSVTVTCLPAAGKEAKSYSLNGGAAQTISNNTFTITNLTAAENTLEVTFGDVE